ncbi:hypothetical protein AcW1_001963 [Taiwanofungus camphoratus]|nr:hypothetical protein AcW1_001963 [Antrodia cinnamomea]
MAQFTKALGGLDYAVPALSPAQSVAALLKYIDSVGPQDNGMFREHRHVRGEGSV